MTPLLAAALAVAPVATAEPDWSHQATTIAAVAFDSRLIHPLEDGPLFDCTVHGNKTCQPTAAVSAVSVTIDEPDQHPQVTVYVAGWSIVCTTAAHELDGAQLPAGTDYVNGYGNPVRLLDAGGSETEARAYARTMPVDCEPVSPDELAGFVARATEVK
jgi:hypothetical protein